ncbi:MAG TPA: hypothetical protein VGB84_00925 [Arachidicoccus sp.]
MSFDFLSRTEDIKAFFDELFGELSTFDTAPKDYFWRAITNSSFEVRDKVIFYSVLAYCINRDTKVPNEGLKHFIRIIRNQLFSVRQTNQTRRIEFTSNLRLPSVFEYCKFVDGLLKAIIPSEQKTVYQIFASSELSGFTKENIGNEKAKAEFINSNPGLAKNIFALEEHTFIQGNTANFKLDTKNAANKIDAFLSIWNKDVKDHLIIRAFLTAGDFSVMTHSYSSLNEIWYFGSTGNWNRILTANERTEREKVSQTLDMFLESYLKVQGNSVSEKLQAIIDGYQSDTKKWQYYFIKYEPITNCIYNRINLFTWADEDGFDINSLGNSGNQPLHSYHLNPYLSVLKQHFRKEDKVTLYWGRFTDISHLRITDKVDIKCIKQGWRIFPLEDFMLSKEVTTKYNLEQKGNFFLLNVNYEDDRIEIAIQLIQDLL